MQNSRHRLISAAFFAGAAAVCSLVAVATGGLQSAWSWGWDLFGGGAILACGFGGYAGGTWVGRRGLRMSAFRGAALLLASFLGWILLADVRAILLFLFSFPTPYGLSRGVWTASAQTLWFVGTTFFALWLILPLGALAGWAVANLPLTTRSQRGAGSVG
jgi:hypothetical protein